MVELIVSLAEKARSRVGTAWVAVALVVSLAAPVRGMAADDPLEPFNRAMFSFNKSFLTNVVNPTVDYLGPRTPEPVKVSLLNAYNNLTEIEFILNGALRRDLDGMAIPAKRFAINSTVGLAGLFDVAGKMGIQRRESDFIESLCKAGVPPGPYLVLPLIGSANLNSAAALSGAIVIEVYALSFISTSLATADFLIIDLGGSAAGLRYMNAASKAQGQDPYLALRTDHMNYVIQGCENGTDNPVLPQSAGMQPILAKSTGGDVLAGDQMIFRRSPALHPSMPLSLKNRVSPSAFCSGAGHGVTCFGDLPPI